jgi:hypothetical protein
VGRATVLLLTRLHGATDSSRSGVATGARGSATVAGDPERPVCNYLLSVPPAEQGGTPDPQAELMAPARLADLPIVRSAGLSYFPLAFLARLPFAMMTVGVLTLVVAERGSVTLGGLNSACAGIGTALAGPLLGAAAGLHVPVRGS